MATNGILNVFFSVNLSMQIVLIGDRWVYFRYPLDISIHTLSEDYILRDPNVYLTLTRLSSSEAGGHLKEGCTPGSKSVKSTQGLSDVMISHDPMVTQV